MLSHVQAWLRRILVGKCNSSHPLSFLSLDPLINVLKQDSLIAHLREAVEPLNAECYHHVIYSIHGHLPQAKLQASRTVSHYQKTAPSPQSATCDSAQKV